MKFAKLVNKLFKFVFTVMPNKENIIYLPPPQPRFFNPLSAKHHFDHFVGLASSVKRGHLGHFDLEPNKHNFPTNPMGSSGTHWARLYNNNYKSQK